MDINVCIVDDNKDIRSALEQIITMSEGYNLVGSCPTAEEALLHIPIIQPDIVLMDIDLGEGDNGMRSPSQSRLSRYFVYDVYGV